MCVDFMDLNKACLRDFYPLLNIDSLDDATLGYIILNFIDAFFEYNHILIWEEDWFKIAFIIDE